MKTGLKKLFNYAEIISDTLNSDRSKKKELSVIIQN